MAQNFRRSKIKTIQSKLDGSYLYSTVATHPIHALTPARVKYILSLAEQGELQEQSDLFADMEESDGHLHAELSKRKRTIISYPWRLDAPKNATREELDKIELITDIINDIPDFTSIIYDMLSAIGYGFSCSEITWKRKNGLYIPKKIEYRPQSWFRLDSLTKNEILLNVGAGEQLWEYGWIVHIHKAVSGTIARSGLFRVLVNTWLQKQFASINWDEFLDLYGIPFKIGKYDSNASETDKDNFFDLLQHLNRHSSAIMHDSMVIDMMSGVTGTADTFLSKIEYCDDVISKAILGQTLSTTAIATGMGSGVADLQGEVRKDLLMSDIRQLQNTLNHQLLKPLCSINWLFDPDRMPKFVYDVNDTTDLTNLANAVNTLVNLGFEVPVKWIRDMTSIPEPLTGEKILGVPVL